MRERATGNLLLHCKIHEANGLYTMAQDQFEQQKGIYYKLHIAPSIRTNQASRLHHILNHALVAG